jgi:hypothetical protein
MAGPVPGRGPRSVTASRTATSVGQGNQHSDDQPGSLAGRPSLISSTTITPGPRLPEQSLQRSAVRTDLVHPDALSDQIGVESSRIILRVRAACRLRQDATTAPSNSVQRSASGVRTATRPVGCSRVSSCSWTISRPSVAPRREYTSAGSRRADGWKEDRRAIVIQL